MLKIHTISNEYTKRVNHILTDLNTTSVVKTPTDSYDNLIKANEEVAKCLLNKKRKPRDKIASQDNKIKTLRNDVQITYNAYTAQNTIEYQEKLSQAKRLLQEEYENIET